MNTEMNGKPISEVWFPGDGNSLNQRMRSNEDGNLTLSATYHGDHDEFWIVRTKDGKELSRVNVRYVTEIIWAE